MKLKKISLILAIIVTLTNFSFAAEVAKGKTIRLETFSGSVEVKSGSGKNVNVYEKMRVFDGYSIKTQNDAEVYLSLDDTKAVKLGSNTEVKVKKSWFSNKITVISGELFFNVTKPLESNEKLDISTPTMSMGIRGTSGSVIVDDEGTNAQIYTGKVEAKGLHKKIHINAGEQAISDTDLRLIKLKNDGSEIPSMALNEINNDDKLKNEIRENTELDVNNFSEQEKINSENEKEEREKEANELETLKENAQNEKNENKKSSTTNKSVTGKSSGGGSSKAVLTWEILTEWISKTTDDADKIYGISDLVSFASSYSSSLDISGYNSLNDLGKEMVENMMLSSEDGTKGYLGYLLTYESLESFTTGFNNAVNNAEKETPSIEEIVPSTTPDID